MKTVVCFRWLGAIAWFVYAAVGFAEPIPREVKIGGFAVGCQAWTFNRFTAYEAVEKTALAGAKVIEFFPGQRLRPDSELRWDHHASDEIISQMREHLVRYGIRAVNYGVVGGRDETEWRRIFEFARKLGLYAITTEDVDKLDLLERLAREFDIRVGIHNHPRRPNDPNYRIWSPTNVWDMIRGRDARLGAAADTGHWATSGVDPLEGLRLLSGRIISVHLKDRTVIGRQTADVPYGSGVLNVAALLDELKRQGFVGNVSIEYETKWENNVPDVAQCIGFFRGYGTCR
ncbi:MAG: sugar phosphate isomerase/epimerase family protein [Verrucomicrobiota bacterium]|nr:sugar phosphate isomerase/epimerase [Limisphaera sp.]MDW8381389.1 sugar phosphate isomerase/epimerase family protein [Verrucomicrobiota bacterium]